MNENEPGLSFKGAPIVPTDPAHRGVIRKWKDGWWLDTSNCSCPTCRAQAAVVNSYLGGVR